MNISNHSKERAKERLSFNKKTLEKMAKTALEKGLKHSDATGNLKKYFDSLYLKYRTATNTRIYGEYVYLFCEENLITVFPLPNNLKDIAKKLNKKIGIENAGGLRTDC